MLLKFLEQAWQPPCALGRCHHQELVNIDEGDEGMEWACMAQAQVIQLDLPGKGEGALKESVEVEWSDSGSGVEGKITSHV